MKEIMRLRAERVELIKQARALLDKAQGEKRNLNEDENAKYANLKEQIRSLQEQEERLIEVEGLESELRAMGSDDQRQRDPGNGDANQGQSEEQRFTSFGEQMQAVVRAFSPGARTVDARLHSAPNETRAQGLNEGVPSQGGFLVQTDFATELLRRVYETGVLSPRVRKIPISANSNGLKMNGVDETSRQNGSRWGGVRGYWLAEAGTATPTKPKFRQIELDLKKLIGACWATDELLQDAAALGAVLQEAFSEEFAFLVDEAIYRGSGAGAPLGILNSPALVTVDKETGQAASTVVYENIIQMWSRMYSRSRPNSVWYIDQSLEPQLYSMSLAVGTGGVPVYLPAGGASASPYGTLKGRPVVPIEQASALGTVGDITLADLSQYMMIDKGGMQSASSIHVSFLTDEQVFRFVYRVDGQPIWNSPLTPYNGGNTLSPFVTLAERA